MSAVKVTVYSKPSCVQCTATKRWLDKNQVEYTEVDVTEDAEALEYTRSLGYLQAPVTVVERTGGKVHASGFDPDFLYHYLGK